MLGLHHCILPFSGHSEGGTLHCGCPASSLWWHLLYQRQALEDRVSTCGSGAWSFCSVWDLPGPGIEPTSPARVGGFLTSGPADGSSAHFNIRLFIFLILNCMSCLDINFFCLYHLQYFSHSGSFLFIMLMVSFAVKKHLSLIRPLLFIFAFISFAFNNRSKNIATMSNYK